MKTQSFRVWALGVVGITTIVLGTGCHQQEARAEVPSADQIVPQIVPADPTTLNAAAPDDATKFEAPVAPVNLAGAPDLEKTNVSTNVAMPKLVQNPVIPDDLKVSPALEEVLKLAQAGVSQEVMLAYITHSTTFFNVTSDAIVYLNDLGVSNDVITALIQHDSTPEMQARRQMVNSVQPLPKDLALTSPATNVYPPSVTQTTDAVPVDTNVPPAPANAEVTTVAPPAEQPTSVSYFYSSLAPYGSWIDVDGYGLAGSRRWWWVIPVGVLIRPWPLALVKPRLVLVFGLLVGLGAISLRSLVRLSARGLGLGARHALGSVVGKLALFVLILWLGAVAAACLLALRIWVLFWRHLGGIRL